ncbi:hypothetical protein MRB53_005827 [Persea americana]|uniref:Uncharacterized protein n=1 Tax=Persea americana TaxID=3435 RepID=A0ACC2MEF3_PERAE|nr:hypothetical protein MRB53_005827 [Persea americana]
MEGYKTRNSHFNIAPAACLRIQWYRKEGSSLYSGANSEFKFQLRVDNSQYCGQLAQVAFLGRDTFLSYT